MIISVLSDIHDNIWKLKGIGYWPVARKGEVGYNGSMRCRPRNQMGRSNVLT